MKVFVLLILIIAYLFSGCTSIIYPLKKVKENNFNNPLLLIYAEKYKYIGKTRVNYPSALSGQQKKHLKGDVENYLTQRGFCGFQKTGSYKDYQFNRESYNAYIEKFFSNNVNFKVQFLKIFNDEASVSNAYNYLIHRENQGLVYTNLVVSIIEYKGELKLAIIADYSRSELSKSIKNNLFTFVFFPCVTSVPIYQDVSSVLMDYLDIEQKYKIHKSREKYESELRLLKYKMKD